MSTRSSSSISSSVTSTSTTTFLAKASTPSSSSVQMPSFFDRPYLSFPSSSPVPVQKSASSSILTGFDMRTAAPVRTSSSWPPSSSVFLHPPVLHYSASEMISDLGLLLKAQGVTDEDTRFIVNSASLLCEFKISHEEYLRRVWPHLQGELRNHYNSHVRAWLRNLGSKGTLVLPKLLVPPIELESHPFPSLTGNVSSSSALSTPNPSSHSSPVVSSPHPSSYATPLPQASFIPFPTSFPALSPSRWSSIPNQLPEISNISRIASSYLDITESSASHHVSSHSASVLTSYSSSATSSSPSPSSAISSRTPSPSVLLSFPLSRATIASPASRVAGPFAAGSAPLPLSNPLSNFQQPKRRRREWSEEEDKLFLKGLKERGVDYDYLATLLPRRTKPQIQAHFYYLAHTLLSPELQGTRRVRSRGRPPGGAKEVETQQYLKELREVLLQLQQSQSIPPPPPTLEVTQDVMTEESSLLVTQEQEGPPGSDGAEEEAEEEEDV